MSPLPCPFCGGEPNVASDRSFIACRDTDCPVNPGVERNWKQESADEIEARWNTRKVVKPPEVLECLRQYVDDLRFPPTGDSVQRRIERAERVIALLAAPRAGEGE